MPLLRKVAPMESGISKLRDQAWYVENLLKIRNKEGKIILLRMNTPQKKLYEAVKAQRDAGRPVRVIILKARQMGFSTLTEGMMFQDSATRFNVNSLVVAHKDDATANLFQMNKLYYENLPEPLKPQRRASNAQELVFNTPTNGEGKGLNSRIKCATAGGNGVGRSDTLTNAHLSEFAFWPGDKKATLIGILQAVPSLPGTMVVIESTANGYDEFKDLWDEAVSAWDRGERDGFQPIFFAWWELEEYRMPAPPGFEPDEDERALMETYKLELEQLVWRRWAIKNLCAGDKRIFQQEYPASPDEAFLASGTCVFDSPALVRRRAEVKDIPWEWGSFKYDYAEAWPAEAVTRSIYDNVPDPRKKIRNIKWEPSEKGLIRIFKRPEKGKPYVLGGDTAGTGSDKFTGQVLDNVTGAQVAVLQHQFDETLYARQMFCLGMYYNGALIGVETNYSTYPEKELERLGYPNLFVRRQEDTFTAGIKKAYGFETTSVTRPLIIDGLKTVAREHLELIGDYETLGEMLSFVYNEAYRPEAEQGKHDDLVMALAIAHYLRGYQSREAVGGNGKTVKWSKDQWEDYNNANEEGKLYLLKKWGYPF